MNRRSVKVDRVKLTAEMARLYMTRYELAQLSGLSEPTITNVRAGKICTRSTARKIADGLGVPLSAILSDSD